MEQTLDLKVLFYMIRKKFVWIVVAAFLGAIAGFLVSEYLIPDTFVSSTQVYIRNSQETEYVEKVSGSDISTARSMASTYCIILGSPRATALLESKLQQNETYLNTLEALRKYTVTVSVKSDSEVLNIAVKGHDPVIVALVCNTMVDVAAELVNEIFESGRSNSLGEAPVNYSPTFPNVRYNMLIGVLVGVLISAAFIVLSFLIDNRVKDETDFVRKIGVPVLGEVPSMHTPGSKKEEYAYYVNAEKEDS